MKKSETNMSRRTMDPAPMLRALYPVAIAIMFVPLFEMSVGIWPIRLEQVSWRIGTMGLLLKSLLVPLFGLGIAAAISAFLDSRRVLRFIAVFALTVTFFLVTIVVLFALDYVQARPGIPPQMHAAMDRSALSAVVIGALLIPVALSIGVGSWKVSRLSQPQREELARSKKDVGLVVPTPPNPKESAT